MSKLAYYQYQKETNLPIFIAVDPQSFDSGFADFLGAMKFTKLSEKEEVDALLVMKKNNTSRCLN
ncbi:MAG: hypothetical protein K2Q18_13845, partial [Bdellovibrionales bacterium]|nr:hypothetical protein [Bdellovibrionales bacterium]